VPLISVAIRVPCVADCIFGEVAKFKPQCNISKSLISSEFLTRPSAIRKISLVSNSWYCKLNLFWMYWERKGTSSYQCLARTNVLEVFLRADARQHEDLWRLHCSGAQNYFFSCYENLVFSVFEIFYSFHSLGTFFNNDLSHLKTEPTFMLL
jgi:hypothetical protein